MKSNATLYIFVVLFIFWLAYDTVDSYRLEKEKIITKKQFQEIKSYQKLLMQNNICQWKVVNSDTGETSFTLVVSPEKK
jgi:hypothetical protein